MRTALVGLALLSLAACDAEAPLTEDDPPGGKADEASDAVRMPDSIHWLRNSAEYQAAARQAYALATRLVEERPASDEPWAVVTDADETILDNSQYQKERAAAGAGWSQASWSAWVERKEAKAVPGAKRFFDRVHALGGLVVVVTNRGIAECADSEENMRALGLEPDLVLCKDGDSEKEPRFDAVEGGTASPELPAAKVVLFVGDNIADFPELDQGIRDDGDDAFVGFGATYVVIPNPMYGSWERNRRN
jgi:5'-nucleotidase (lipoprotein e(P4) family)